MNEEKGSDGAAFSQVRGGAELLRISRVAVIERGVVVMFSLIDSRQKR